MHDTKPRGHEADKPETGIWRQIGWFAVIWAASILALSVVAFGIRLVLQ